MGCCGCPLRVKSRHLHCKTACSLYSPKQTLIVYEYTLWSSARNPTMADIWNKYEPTAARKRGTPGRQARPKSLTVDMHAHVAVPRAGEIAAPHLKAATDPLV